MKTKQYLTILLLLILYSCSNKKKSVLEKTKSDKENIMELKRKCVQEGDIQSFDELVLYYSYHEKLEYELLPIAIIMADTYHAKKSYLIVYLSTIKIYNKGIYSIYNFRNLTSEQKAFALYYLEKGVFSSDSSCILELARLNKYGIGMQKNIEKSKFYENLYRKKNPSCDFEKKDEYEMKNGIL